MKVTVTACKQKRTKVEVNAVTTRREAVRVPVKRMESQPHIYVKARNVSVREKYRPEEFEEAEFFRELFAEDVEKEPSREDDGLPEIFVKPLKAMRDVEDSISMDNLPLYFDPRALSPEEEEAEELTRSHLAEQWDEQNGEAYRSQAFRNSFGGYGVPGSSNVRAVDRNTTEAELLDIIDRQQRRGSEQSAERAERAARELAAARERAEQAALKAGRYDDEADGYSASEEEDIYNWWSDIEAEDAPTVETRQEEKAAAAVDAPSEEPAVCDAPAEESAVCDAPAEEPANEAREEKRTADETADNKADEAKASENKASASDEKHTAERKNDRKPDTENKAAVQPVPVPNAEAEAEAESAGDILPDAAKTFRDAKHNRKFSMIRNAADPFADIDDPDLEYGEIYIEDMPEQFADDPSVERVDLYLVDSEAAGMTDDDGVTFDDDDDITYGAADDVLPKVGEKFSNIKSEKKAKKNNAGRSGKKKGGTKDKLPDIPGAHYMVRDDSGDLIEVERKDIPEGQAVYIVDDFGKLLSGSGAIYGKGSAEASADDDTE